MIKQVIKLIRPGIFLPCFAVEELSSEKIVVRPRYLSICAADQRYFNGNRPPEVLKRKLPMALIHEAVGEIVFDPKNRYKKGTFCVLLPGGVDSERLNSNYEKNSFFRSSNADGFCQELVSLNEKEIIPIYSSVPDLYSFAEPLSICCQAIKRVKNIVNSFEKKEIGIWGDGSIAFLMAIAVRSLIPDSNLTIFGKHEEKLSLFSFANKRVNISDFDYKTICSQINIAFECVGGNSAHIAINEIIQNISPCGTIVLTGVSESYQPLDTRMILEKGIVFIGSSRSDKDDFKQAIQIIDSPFIQINLQKIIDCKAFIKSESELTNAFIQNNKKMFKSILSLEI